MKRIYFKINARKNRRERDEKKPHNVEVGNRKKRRSRNIAMNKRIQLLRHFAAAPKINNLIY